MCVMHKNSSIMRTKWAEILRKMEKENSEYHLDVSKYYQVIHFDNCVLPIVCCWFFFRSAMAVAAQFISVWKRACIHHTTQATSIVRGQMSHETERWTRKNLAIDCDICTCNGSSRSLYASACIACITFFFFSFCPGSVCLILNVRIWFSTQFFLLFFFCYLLFSLSVSRLLTLFVLLQKC